MFSCSWKRDQNSSLLTDIDLLFFIGSVTDLGMIDLKKKGIDIATIDPTFQQNSLKASTENHVGLFTD